MTVGPTSTETNATTIRKRLPHTVAKERSRRPDYEDWLEALDTGRDTGGNGAQQPEPQEQPGGRHRQPEVDGRRNSRRVEHEGRLGGFM